MVTRTLYASQQKRHRYIKQSFGLCGRGWGWDDLGECHWNMYSFFSLKQGKSSIACVWARSSPLPFLVNNVFLEHRHSVLFTYCLWLSLFRRRQWQPTPVLLPEKSHGRRSLVGCSSWGHEESDTYWATSLSLFSFMLWRRKWQPIPVFLPGKSQGQRSRVGCHLWGRTESDTTEAT